MNANDLRDLFLNSCIEQQCLSPYKVPQAQMLAKASGKEIFDVLLDLGLLSLDQINNILSRVSGYPKLDPLVESLRHPPTKEALACVSQKVAINSRVFPLRIEDGELQLVMANPTDDSAVRAIQEMCGYPVKRFVCYPKNVLRTVARYYSAYGRKSFEELVQDGLDEVSGKRRIEPIQSIWTEPLGQALYREISLFPRQKQFEEQPPEPGEVAVSLLVRKILDNAIFLGASDVHFEPFQDVIKVRFRRDGVLFSQWFIPDLLRTNLFNRIKIIGGMNPSITRRTQSGHIKYDPARMIGVDIRASIVPTLFGERLALRLLDKGRTLLNPLTLGMEPDDLRTFMGKIISPQGLILITGPTGSGKTTTIYSALDTLNQEERCIMTIEDPIEYLMSGVSQVQIDQRNDLGYAAAFREVLRQDPNVILLGEIRDSESAEVAVSASATGHLVFSTLHTNDAAGAVQRLISMGADAFVIADSLQLIIAQRLVRRLCLHCKQPDELSEERLQQLGLSSEQLADGKYYRPVGCPRCKNMGYQGRIAVFEILQPNSELRGMINENRPARDIKQAAVKAGMRTIRCDALLKAGLGITSLDEVVRVTVE
ncbi:MAG: ATPase, T2SS/T4P/T4SS family [Candidatus Alcyoniella australis]|nr:ATPase, T2SS/T4P/T4SS family [Candidatus Alcyoniella australis]